MAVYTWDPASGAYVLSADQSFAVTTDQSDYSPGQTVHIDSVNSDGSRSAREVTLGELLGSA